MGAARRPRGSPCARAPRARPAVLQRELCARPRSRTASPAPSCRHRRRWARPPGRGSRPRRQLLPASPTSSLRCRGSGSASPGGEPPARCRAPRSCPRPSLALQPGQRARVRSRSPRPTPFPVRPGHAVLPVPRRVPRRDRREYPCPGPPGSPPPVPLLPPAAATLPAALCLPGAFLPSPSAFVCEKPAGGAGLLPSRGVLGAGLYPPAGGGACGQLAAS